MVWAWICKCTSNKTITHVNYAALERLGFKFSLVSKYCISIHLHITSFDSDSVTESSLGINIYPTVPAWVPSTC